MPRQTRSILCAPSHLTSFPLYSLEQNERMTQLSSGTPFSLGRKVLDEWTEMLHPPIWSCKGFPCTWQWQGPAGLLQMSLQMCSRTGKAILLGVSEYNWPRLLSLGFCSVVVISISKARAILVICSAYKWVQHVMDPMEPLNYSQTLALHPHLPYQNVEGVL